MIVYNITIIICTIFLIILILFLYNFGNIYELLSLSYFSILYNEIDKNINNYFLNNKNIPVLLAVGNNIIYKEVAEIKINSVLNKIYIKSVDYNIVLDLDKDADKLKFILFLYKDFIN